jgi:hypothetical protein
MLLHKLLFCKNHVNVGRAVQASSHKCKGLTELNWMALLTVMNDGHLWGENAWLTV